MAYQKLSALPSHVRTTYPLQGTHSTNNRVQLDFPSVLAVRWVESWVAQNGGLKVPLSGVLRRALAVYVRHLESLDPSRIRHEVYMVKAACAGTPVPIDEQEAATARLGASLGTLSPFQVVLHGQHHVDAQAVLFKRLAILNEIPPTPVKAPGP